MEKIYKAKDGKIFTNDKECEVYEKKLDEKELTRKQAAEKVEKAKVDFENACKVEQEKYKAYFDIMKEFNEKYGAYHTKITVGEIFPFDIMNIFNW